MIEQTPELVELLSIGVAYGCGSLVSLIQGPLCSEGYCVMHLQDACSRNNSRDACRRLDAWEAPEDDDSDDGNGTPALYAAMLVNHVYEPDAITTYSGPWPDDI